MSTKIEKAITLMHTVGQMLRDTEEDCDACSSSRVWRQLEWCDIHHGGRAMTAAYEDLLPEDVLDRVRLEMVADGVEAHVAEVRS